VSSISMTSGDPVVPLCVERTWDTHGRHGCSHRVNVCEGGMDSSVHFLQSSSAASNKRLVSVDDVCHGTKAALAAGNTTVGQ